MGYTAYQSIALLHALRVAVSKGFFTFHLANSVFIKSYSLLFLVKFSFQHRFFALQGFLGHLSQNLPQFHS